MKKELQKDVISITVTHDNAYAFNAVYRAICEAAEKEAFRLLPNQGRVTVA